MLLASLIVPVGLQSSTELAWLSGIVLAGLAVVSVGVGLLGLYPGGRDHAPRLALAGTIGAAASGIAGLILLASSGLTFATHALSSVEFAVGMRTFAALALTMAGGYAAGFLLLGLAVLRSDYPPGRTGHLLAGGGVLLLVPVVGELLRLWIGIGPPPWILFPVLGSVAIATVAVGVGLRPEVRSGDASGR